MNTSSVQIVVFKTMFNKGWQRSVKQYLDSTEKGNKWDKPEASHNVRNSEETNKGINDPQSERTLKDQGWDNLSNKTHTSNI